jgi:hypothetical protein
MREPRTIRDEHAEGVRDRLGVARGAKRQAEVVAHEPRRAREEDLRESVKE